MYLDNDKCIQGKFFSLCFLFFFLHRKVFLINRVQKLHMNNSFHQWANCFWHSAFVENIFERIAQIFTSLFLCLPYFLHKERMRFYPLWSNTRIPLEIEVQFASKYINSVESFLKMLSYKYRLWNLVKQ